MRREQADDELLSMATKLAEKCKEFNVTGQIKHICPGPVVTTYEFKPDPGVKYSRVVSLVDDLCLALKAESIRIDRMPGKPHVGIEVPNPRRETIFLREVIESRAFQRVGLETDDRARQNDRRAELRRRSREDAALADRRHDRRG